MDGHMLSPYAAPEAPQGARQIDSALGFANSGYPDNGLNGGDAAPEAVDQYASIGSVNSLRSGMDEDCPPIIPNVCDIKRLQKLKADQEQRLKSLCTRVDRLTSQEQRVWKDVAHTQQRSLHAQEKQWQRQAQEAERLRTEREAMVHQQALQERVRSMRLRTLETKDIPRTEKFEENKRISRQVREDVERHARALRTVRQQEIQAKAMQVELQRQQRRQQKLQRELDITRQEQARQDMNMLRFAELQEEIQNAEVAINVAEREELSAVHRLQNSQTVRNEVSAQLHDIETSSQNSPRSANPLIREAEEVMMPGSGSARLPRSGTASARTSRSSPRLGASGGAAPLPLRGRLDMQGDRSSPGLASTSVGRSDLGQISEEDASALDSVGQKPPSGPRTRALQMQRQRQSPTRPLAGNAASARAATVPSTSSPRYAQEETRPDMLQQHRADMARRLQQNLSNPDCRSAVKGGPSLKSYGLEY